MKTQMASTPTLEGEDAERLLDSLKNRPTEQSRRNALKLKEYFTSGYLSSAENPKCEWNYNIGQK